MPHRTVYKVRDSPTYMSGCEPSRHNPGSGIMTKRVQVGNLRGRQVSHDASPQLRTSTSRNSVGAIGATGTQLLKTRGPMEATLI